jgi:two-component system OmpR family sensor kinase
MTRWTGLPIRRRLTVAFAACMALVVAALSVFVYFRTGFDLLDTVDASLRAQAELLVADVQRHGPAVVDVEPTLTESDEAFAQIADRLGRILESSSRVSRSRLLSSGAIRSLDAATFFDRRIAGIDSVARILAVPVKTSRGRLVVVVGASLQDRRDEMVQLAATLAIAGSVALGLISVAAWLALARALSPVERMRRQAAAISATQPRGRLSLSGGSDEIALLGATLNQMLDRIEESVNHERRLVDRASHELRTPLAIQRMDLDLALSGPQTPEDLTAALQSVSQENAHLIRLTQDLLVLSKARGGVLPIRRVETWLPSLLDDARRRNGVLAGLVQVSFRASSERVRIDPVWFRQAVDNLVDNAVRHTPDGGHVTVSASRRNSAVVLVVEDTGPGFTETVLHAAFEPFAPTGQEPGTKSEAAGLGLAVVRAIAEAHGGHAWAENRPGGGAKVTMTMADG